jgi:NAD(P)-dependent dehydrogenase (short-subunit alcohol dehydrogenase family)
MRRSLRGKVVVVTGASAGIGRATALAFAAEGAHIVVAARRAERLEELQRVIETAGGRCLAAPTDVADRAQVLRLLEATLEHFGRVDVWVNNAGYGLVGSVEQTTEDDMRRILEVNYMGAFHGCQIALEQMRRQGSGHIINVSSMVGRFGLALNAAYSATKHAMNGLTEALAQELEGTGIYASVVMPGITETDFGASTFKKIPPATGHSSLSVSSARSVALRIVRCARGRSSVVMIAPAPRLLVALVGLCPWIWRVIARRYVAFRTDGRGVPVP